MTRSMLERIYGSPDDYKAFGEFVRSYPSLSYIQFDAYVTEKLDLFTLPEGFDFDRLSDDLDMISAALPSMIRIFERPIIRLRDIPELLPVEAVRKTGRNTVRYAATHSKTWESFDESGIKPRSLLTEKYEDNFSIYENVVFAGAVDTVLSYLAANLRLVGSLIYRSRRQLDIDALSRVDHINYFLALGKLHTGYIRNFRKYTDAVAENCRRMNRMYSALSSHLGYPVYRMNRGKYKNIPLKKTNVFAMDKDYKTVYKFMQSFGREMPQSDRAERAVGIADEKNYRYFCLILLIFSAYHFGFASPDSQKIDFDEPDITMNLKGWSLSIRAETAQGRDVTELEISKERTYRIIMIPDISGSAASLNLKRADESGESVILSPDPQSTDALFISVSDIDSFRRFQQLLLRGMVYSDSARNDCPFCGAKLESAPKAGDGARHICRSCGTEIKEKLCPVTGESYFETGMTGCKPAPADKSGSPCGDLSELLFFRNITPLTPRGDNICPRCKTVHK